MLDRRSFAFGFASAAAAAILANPARAAGVALSQSAHTFRFEWLEGAGRGSADAQIDLGRLSADAQAIRKRRIEQKRRLAVRIDGPGPAVRVSVAMLTDAPGCSVRIDGHELSTIPRVIDAAHRVGTSVVHTLDIVIPHNVPAGPFLTNMQWVAEAI